MEPAENTPETDPVQSRLQRIMLLPNTGRIFWITLSLTFIVALWFRSKLGFSGGHMDEYDYLFVGRNLLAEQTWPTHQYIFGSDFNWYLFGFAEQFVGGLTGARSLSAALGLLSIAGVYWFTYELWKSHRIAAVSAVLLAMQASHVFISRLATYDIISFTLLVLSLVPLLKASRNSNAEKGKMQQYLWLLAGMILLVGAVLAKYTTVVYLPLLAAVMLYRDPRAALCGVLAGSIALALYVSLHWADLVILYQNQIAGTHGANTTRVDILLRSWQYCGSLLLLWGFCWLVLFSARQTQRWHVGVTLLLLLLFASPLFLYHWHGRNLISLYKHLVFACLFLVPAVAWGIVNAVDHWACSGRSRAPVALLLFAVFMASYSMLNISRLQQMQQGFPDVSAVAATASSESLLVNEVLSEDPYLFRYLGFGVLPQSQIRETSWLDNDGDGVHSLGDVKDALWDRKFGLVLLNDQVHPLANPELRAVMLMRGYRLLYENPYQLSSVMTANTRGTISLYQRLDDWRPVVSSVDQVSN